jgi:hypothetical protein
LHCHEFTDKPINERTILKSFYYKQTIDYLLKKDLFKVAKKKKNFFFFYKFDWSCLPLSKFRFSEFGFHYKILQMRCVLPYSSEIKQPPDYGDFDQNYAHFGSEISCLIFGSIR